MGGISFFSYTETQKRLQDLDAVYGQIVALVEVGDTIMLMESSQRGFLITGSQNYLDPYNKLRETMDRKLEATKKLYENTLDQSRVNALSELIKERIVILDRNIEIKKTGKEEAIEQNLLMKEGRNTMDMIVVTGRDLQDRRRTEREKIVSGFRALGSVRVYMSFTLMVAALVQMLFAAILGRSKIPIQPYRPASDETFFP
jgi:CHASE3 domain sensor protein